MDIAELAAGARGHRTTPHSLVLDAATENSYSSHSCDSLLRFA